MKTYKGVIEGPYEWKVFVVEDGVERPLEHHVYHSPDGHSWGYGGSGPSELAKDILWDLFGKQPAPNVYQSFKWDYIASLSMREGFELEGTDILAWYATWPKEDAHG